MFEILGNKYLTAKEAAHRYGYSMSWFKKRRANKQPPEYHQMESKSRILYRLDKTDDWFKKNLRE